MRNPCPQIAASGRVFKDAILDPFLIENFFVERNRPHFIPRRIRRIDPQILLHPCHCQVGILLQVFGRDSGRRHRWSWGVRGLSDTFIRGQQRHGRAKEHSPVSHVPAATVPTHQVFQCRSPPDFVTADYFCARLRQLARSCRSLLLPDFSTQFLYQVSQNYPLALSCTYDEYYNVFRYQGLSRSTLGLALASNLI